MLNVFVYYTLPQFLSNSFKIFQLLACFYKQSRKLCRLRSAGFSKASWSCSTLFQNRIYQEFSMQKGLLIKTEKLKGKMVIYFFDSFVIYYTKCCIVSVSWNDLTIRYVCRQKTYRYVIQFQWIVAALLPM